MRYLVALGSNRRHLRHGTPRAVLAAALRALAEEGLHVLAASRIMTSAPLGPSARRYANAAALVETPLGPRALLALLQGIEARFGRRRRGQRWGARVLDLDIVLWDGGCWADDALVIPHGHFRKRDFVLSPAREIARDWRDPLDGLSLAHHHARLNRRRPRG